MSGSAVTTPEQLTQSAIKGGSYNGYPFGIWIGTSLIVDAQDPNPHQWPALSRAIKLLKQKPTFLDGLLRDAASDERIPDPGKALLLGCIKSPGDRDRAALIRLWNEAMKPGAVIAPVPVGISNQDDRIEPYNLFACSVVYAFTKWRDAASLRKLWDAAFGGNDETLTSEIAMGLAMCGQPEDLDRLTAYVTTQWERNARRTDLRKVLGELRPRTDVRYTLSRLLEDEYRSREIHGYFSGTPGTTAAIQRFISDARLHPLLRLEWILFAVTHDKKQLFPSVGEALIQLEDTKYKADSLAVFTTEARNLMGMWLKYRPRD